MINSYSNNNNNDDVNNNNINNNHESNNNDTNNKKNYKLKGPGIVRGKKNLKIKFSIFLPITPPGHP